MLQFLYLFYNYLYMYKFEIQDENAGMIKHINDFVLHTDSTTKKAVTVYTSTTTLVINLENKS